MDKRPDLAIFLPSLRGGGAERVAVTLANEFSSRGLTVEVVCWKLEGAYVSELDGVEAVDLGHDRVRDALPNLVCHMRRRRPHAVLSLMPASNVAAVIARAMAGYPDRLVLCEQIVAWGVQWPAPLNWLVRWTYPRADVRVAASAAVAHSYVDRFNLTPGAFEVVHNPVDLDRVQRLANQDPDDPWFSQGAPPVVLGVGRLEPQKGFDTLLRAVSILQRRLPARLLILGEGPERPSLEKLAGDLGMREATRLPGFVTNPWSYMARAAVFCLSSRFEGFGLVVAEAMAVGLGVVATDCGPTSELLDGGRLGPLVPVDDHEALAVALEQTIRQPPPRHLLLAKAASFDVSQVADRYASLLGLVAEARSGGSLPGSSAATGNQP